MRFQNILVHVDTRTDVHSVFERALALAKAHAAVLKIVDIVPELSWPVRATSKQYQELQELLTEKKQTAVDELAERARGEGVTATGKVLFGRTSVEIVREVTRAKHDLVLKAAKGAKSRRMGFLGTSATRLMRFCPCPIWSYRPQRSAGEERVVAAVDASPVDERHARLNRQILEVALSLTTGKPHIAHAWSVYGEHLIKDYMKPADFEALVKESEQQARAKLEDMLRSFNLSVDAPEVHLLRGSGEEELAKFVNAQDYDVLVIGTVGRSGISGLLVGNTAELLLDRVECSILAVRPTEFVSPIGA